jgi:hypothetical protein
MDVSLPQILTVPLATSGVGPNMLLIMIGTAHMQLPLAAERRQSDMRGVRANDARSCILGNV